MYSGQRDFGGQRKHMVLVSHEKALAKHVGDKNVNNQTDYLAVVTRNTC